MYNAIKMVTSIENYDSIGYRKQAISAHEWALCQLCGLSLRLEVKKRKGRKDVPCKWYSELKSKVSC